MRGQRLMAAAMISVAVAASGHSPDQWRLRTVAAPVETAAAAPLPAKPLVIAHRGASAYRAEHTLAGYRLAIAQGADYLEADLVMTGDGVLVARHENELSATTDVARHPEFTDRRRTKQVGGAVLTGWFTEDFTLAELRTLRALPRSRAGATGADVVPTLQEIIDLVRSRRGSGRRALGLYLELKTPGYFGAIGLAPEPRLAEALILNRLTGPAAPVFVESFEEPSLREVRRLVEVPQIQLVWGSDADPALQPTGLARIREYAVGVGIHRDRLREQLTGDIVLAASATDLIQEAHRQRLAVHVFTFGNDGRAEYRRLYGLGVDGVFTDNPDLAVNAAKR